MALPLVPFIAGAAAGVAATYLFKDEKAKEVIVTNSKSLSDGVKKGSDRVKSSFQERVLARFKKADVEPESFKDAEVISTTEGESTETSEKKEAVAEDAKVSAAEEKTVEKKTTRKPRSSKKQPLEEAPAPA